MEVKIYKDATNIKYKTYKSTLDGFEISENEIVVKEDQWGESFSAEISYTLPDLSAYDNPKVKLNFKLENGSGYIFVNGEQVNVAVSDEFIDVTVDLDINNPTGTIKLTPSKSVYCYTEISNSSSCFVIEYEEQSVEPV